MIRVTATGSKEHRPVVAAILRPFLHWSEQLRLITGWGLGSDRQDDVDRMALPATDTGIALSYIAAGDPAGQRVLFIHGSPGQASEWWPYLDACPDGQYRIAVDRPGYGLSRPTSPFPSIAGQAQAIAPLLKDRTIVVGYSFGGPVALSLAQEFPDRVMGLVLIGTPADPRLEHVQPIQRFAAGSWVSRLLPRALNSSNRELIRLRDNLNGLLNGMDRVNVPVTLLQGDRDTLVPKSNAGFLATHLVGRARPRQIFFPKGTHYLPWTYPDTVNQAIACVIRDAIAVV